MDDSHLSVQNQLDMDMYSSVVDTEHIQDSCKYYSLPINTPSLQGFSILHVNARSLKNKMDSFLTFLHASGVEWSVICVSETWLKKDILSYFNIDDYDLFASCREAMEGGGTAVYVHKKYSAKGRQDLIAINSENSFVEVQLQYRNVVKNIVVGAMYRSPGSSHSSYMDCTEQILNKIADEKKFTVLTGDFNYNLLKESEDKNVQCFCNLMSSYGYTNVISRPTRITRDHSSLLDNIFINNEKYFKVSGVITDDLSDHFPVFINLSFSHDQEATSSPKRVFDMNKIPELNNYIQDKLTDFQTLTDANLACELLVNTYTEGINKFSKFVKPCRRRTPLKPWISPSILSSINRKNKLYKKFIHNRNIANENSYKQYRNILTNIIREAKRSYFQMEFHKSSGNGKKTWTLLREVLNSSKQTANLPTTFTTEDGECIANEQVANGFNDFFASIAQHLESNMPASDHNPIDYLVRPDFPEYDRDLVTSESEITAIIKNLNIVGGGLDKISTKILLKTYKSCIHHLVYFFNLCLKTNIFPDQLKIALIVPIYKSGEKGSFTNYRPISLLPIFSKILEKILHYHITSHLEQHQILCSSQFGFRKRHSTYMPVALIVEEITKAMEQNEKVLGLYLDLKKAFDTVNITILLNKLRCLGIGRALLNIIQSYFTNRIQLVEANGYVSEKRNIKLGVPQGSILGPLLFTIYVNDLVNISNKVQFFLFADDTAIIMKGKSYKDIQNKVNEFIPQLTSWFLCNRLTLNPTKTCYQLYSNFSNHQNLDIYINYHRIKRSCTVKYLGIMLDENLKWESHINFVCKKISRDIGIMGRARPHLSSKQLLLLYNSFILPHLNYCAMIWGSAYQTRLQRILVLQKRAVRIIACKPFLFPSNDLFVKYELLKLPDLVIQQNISVLLAYLNNTLPSLISNLFNLNEPLNTRAPGHFVIPFSRYNFRTFCLSFTAPKFWNMIICNMFPQLNDVPRSKIILKKQVKAKMLTGYLKEKEKETKKVCF